MGDGRDDHAHVNGIDSGELARIGCVAVAAAAAVWFRVWEPFTRVSVIGLIGTIGDGWPIFHEACENVRERRMTMELSMTSLAELDLKRTMCLLPRVSATSA